MFRNSYAECDKIYVYHTTEKEFLFEVDASDLIVRKEGLRLLFLAFASSLLALPVNLKPYDMRHIEPNHPIPTRDNQSVHRRRWNPRLQTCRTGTLGNMTYYELIELLGEPYYPTPSGDDRFKRSGCLNTPHQTAMSRFPFPSMATRRILCGNNECAHGMVDWRWKGTDAYARTLFFEYPELHE